MATWSGGYVADSTYAVAWQAAPTPAHLALVCAMAGVVWEPRKRMHVADLGCGRGYTANCLAASNPEWTVLGIDHSPVHIAEAMQTAGRAGLGNALFVEADLATMTDAELDRIPPLDVVMLHGVWTWVSDAVRAGIVRLLARRLKPGGIAYIGYNALPGAGADHGLQRLLRQLAGPVSEAPGAAAAAAGTAMERLRAIAPALKLPETAMLRRLLADPPILEPAFVAHEFLTEHWRPVFHGDLCAALEPAKLEFVGSSNLFEALAALVLDSTQLSILQGLPSGAPQEFLKDLCLPRAFRADVFVRGRRSTESSRALDRVMLAPSTPLPAESPILHVGTGKAALPQPIWESVAAVLNEAPHSIGDLRERIGEGAPHQAEILALLVGTDHALPVYRPPERAAAATRFNQVAAALHAPGGEGRGHFALASPVAAGGVPASALDLALVAALLAGAEPEALAHRLQPALRGEALGAATARIAERLEERVPVWRRFAIL